ncbi:hypothetical protein F4776DRAFT_666883 [Hypoxylon sp. NC0597]|nr:hypothetical protein F4776DRAFT_666883 [Hypoxylon sp. NC0597]
MLKACTRGAIRSQNYDDVRLIVILGDEETDLVEVDNGLIEALGNLLLVFVEVFLSLLALVVGFKVRHDEWARLLAAAPCPFTIPYLGPSDESQKAQDYFDEHEQEIAAP